MIRNVVRAIGGRVSLKAAAGAAPAQVPTAARATAHGLRASSASLVQGKGVRSFSEAAAPAEGVLVRAGRVEMGGGVCYVFHVRVLRPKCCRASPKGRESRSRHAKHG